MYAVQKLEIAVVEAIKELRSEFGKMDLPYVYLSVTCSGPVDHGSIEIQFTVGEGNYSSDSVTGPSIEPALQEYLHRKGWAKRNQTLRVPYFDGGDD